MTPRRPAGPLCRRCGTRCRGRLVLSLLVAGVLTASARADDTPAAAPEQPAERTDATTQPADVEPAAASSRNFLALSRLEAALELTGEYEQRRVRQDGLGLFPGTRQRNTRRTFEELLSLDFDGDVYDPNLLSFGGSVALGLAQERFRETFGGRTETDSDDGYISEYDLNADLFSGKKVSGTAYARRTRDRFSRAFLPSLREERNEYGFALRHTDDRLPMELTFDHREVDRTGSRRAFDDENLVEDRLRYEATWITSPAHSLRFSYEHDDTEERYSGSRWEFQNTRNQFRLDDELLFGDQRQHRLDTVLRYQDESGDYARDLLEIGPRLSLKHNENLSTQYQYQFAREQVGQLEVDVHRADWQLVHQLYENLTTTVDVFGLQERVAGDSDTTELGGAVDWSYTRKNPYGRFSSDLTLTAEDSRTRGSGARVVIDEAATFRDPLPVTLSRPDVVPWTIVVRDTARRRVYRQGLDYFINEVNGYTLLSRNPFGAIALNETVSIDYQHDLDADGSRDTQRVDYRIQQEFNNGVTPYYHVEFRHDDRDRPGRFAYDRDFESNRHRLGVRYRKEPYDLGAELEVLKDEIDPFVAYRVHAGRRLLRRAGATADARADFSQFFFEKSDRGEATVLELSFDARAELNRLSDAFMTTRYRYEDDGSRGRGLIHGVDLEAGVSRKWGQFTVTASVEYDLLTITGSKEDGLTVWLKLRRDFTDLLKATR